MANQAANMVKLALLIDGDNVSATYMPLIEREAAKLGTLALRRIYGQFESGKMKSWLKHVDEYGLTPVNVSPLTRGKNATDLKLTIEAMDILLGRGLDGLCIASSDGDFTPLAERVRAAAVACYGFGMKKAPAGYKKTFDRFYECDTMLAAEKKPARRTAAASDAPKPAAPAPLRAAARQPPAPRQAAVAGPAPQPAQPTRRAQPPSSARPAQAARAEIPAHIVQAVLKIVRAHGGSATFRDIGNELPIEIPKFKAAAHGYGSPKAMLKALHGKHGLEVTEDGHVVLALT